MKEKLKFSLDLYLTGKYDVETRDGQPVEIQCTNGYQPLPIIGYIKGDKNVTSWYTDGRDTMSRETGNDLFLVKKSVKQSVDWRRLWKALAVVVGTLGTLAGLVLLIIYAPIVAAILLGVAVFVLLVLVTYSCMEFPSSPFVIRKPDRRNTR